MERSRQKGWVLVALDLGIDTSTPAGEMVANVMMAVAQWERRIIGQRTREAMAVRKAQGKKLGRPPELRTDVRRRIRRMPAGGVSVPAIVARLETEGVPTARGGS